VSATKVSRRLRGRTHRRQREALTSTRVVRALHRAAEQAFETGAQRADGCWRHVGYQTHLRGPFVGREERN